MNTAIIIATLTFLLVTIGLMTLYYWADARYRRALIARRLNSGPIGPGQRRAAWLAVCERVIWRAGSLVMPRHAAESADLRTRLIHAGYRSEQAVRYFYGSKVCLGLALALLYLLAVAAGGRIGAKTLMQAFIPAALGFYLPGLILSIKSSRRQQQIFRELPDALDTLLICIEAGLSFDMALQRISRELAHVAPVLSGEFGQYFVEIRSGLPRRRVLRQLAERNGSPALGSVVNVLLQSAKFGTDVASALRVHIASMRTERRQNAEEKGAKISTQLTFPLIMLILPALLIIILGPAIINIMQRLQVGL